MRCHPPVVVHDNIRMSKKISKGDVYRKYIFDEMARVTKHSIEELEKYVDSLDDHKAKELCSRCSHSRKNSVYSFISKGPDHWIVKTHSISNIYVGTINARVNGYLNRNGWLLKNIGKDKDIRKLGEFKKWGEIHHRSLSFVAQKNGGKYRLVDGNHRAIKLACSGQKEFELIYYRR